MWLIRKNSTHSGTGPRVDYNNNTTLPGTKMYKTFPAGGRETVIHLLQDFQVAKYSTRAKFCICLPGASQTLKVTQSLVLVFTKNTQSITTSLRP